MLPNRNRLLSERVRRNDLRRVCFDAGENAAFYGRMSSVDMQRYDYSHATDPKNIGLNTYAGVRWCELGVISSRNTVGALLIAIRRS